MSLPTRIVHLLKLIAIAVAGVFFLMLLLVSVLLFTHSGSQVALNIAQQIEPRLSITLEQGSLLRSPTFSNIRWLDNQTQIKIASLNYRFDSSCLFNKVCLQQLSINDGQFVIIERDPTVKNIEETKQSAFKLPIEVLLRDINLTNIHFSFNDTSIALTKLHLHATANKQDITLNSAIDGLSVTLPAETGTVATTTVNSKEIPRSIPALLSQQLLPEITLPFNLHVAPLKVTNFTLKQGDKKLQSLNSLTAQFDFLGAQLAIQSLVLDLPETDLQLAGDIAFTGKYPLNMQVKGQLKSIKQLEPAQLLSGVIYNIKSSGDLSQLHTELLLSNKLSLQLTSQIDLFQKNLPYRLTLNWQNLHWPLTGKTQYSSTAGSLQSHGTINDYQIKLDGDYHIEKIPTGKFHLLAQGTLQQLNLQQLLVNTLDGSANLSGLLTWQDAVKWDGQLAIDKINLAKLKTQYTGNFSGLIKQSLQIKTRQQKTPYWEFTIPAMNINGQFLTRPFAINGVISGDQKNGLLFQDVMVRNAENTMRFNGLLGTKNDLAIKLNIADVGHLLLDSSGKVDGEIKIQGPQDALKLTSNLQGKLLTYQTSKLASFKLNSEALIVDKPLLALQFNAKNLVVAKQAVDTLDLKIKNVKNSDVTKEHQINLVVKNKQQSANLIFKLIQENNSWSGALTAADINLSKQQLILTEPFAITPENENLLIAAHCWKLSAANNKDTGHFCVKKLNIGKQGEADLALNSYMLAGLDPFLPEALNITGSVDADAKIKWTETEKPVFNLHLVSKNMLVNIDKNREEGVSYPVETFKLNLSGNQDKSNLSATIYSKNLVDAKIQGQLFPYKAQPQVNALLDLKLPDLSPLASLTPELDKLKGQLSTQLTVNGSFSNPIVDGQININDGTMTAVNLPVQIDRFNTLITIKNNRATIDGRFYSGGGGFKSGSKTKETFVTDAFNLVDKSIKKVVNVVNRKTKNQQDSEDGEIGRANIKGTIDWRHKLKGNIHFSANKIAVYDYDKVDLLISPDLQLDIAEELKLSGKLLVNKGTITVKELPEGAVTLSQDVIVVDIKRSEGQSNIPLIINLQVKLGQQFSVQAFGLDSIVKGNLLVRKTLKKNPAVYGELTLDDGSYRAFGQQLILQNSRIIFQGPVDSPYIAIEAIRDPNKIEDNVTAGVRVNGTPNKLSLVVFSDPAMAQQEALSYILRGQSLQNSTGNSGSDGDSQIASLLINLGADKSARVINSIGNELGIKDLSLAASGSGEEQSIGVSGYIAPNVEVSYGIGVFDSFSMFAIRYQMFERFYIEASSGVEQAVDAYYKFYWN